MNHLLKSMVAVGALVSLGVVSSSALAKAGSITWSPHQKTTLTISNKTKFIIAGASIAKNNSQAACRITQGFSSVRPGGKGIVTLYCISRGPILYPKSASVNLTLGYWIFKNYDKQSGRAFCTIKVKFLTQGTVNGGTIEPVSVSCNKSFVTQNLGPVGYPQGGRNVYCKTSAPVPGRNPPYCSNDSAATITVMGY